MPLEKADRFNADEYGHLRGWHTMQVKHYIQGSMLCCRIVFTTGKQTTNHAKEIGDSKQAHVTMICWQFLYIVFSSCVARFTCIVSSKGIRENLNVMKHSIELCLLYRWKKAYRVYEQSSALRDKTRGITACLVLVRKVFLLSRSWYTC